PGLTPGVLPVALRLVRGGRGGCPAPSIVCGGRTVEGTTAQGSLKALSAASSNEPKEVTVPQARVLCLDLVPQTRSRLLSALQHHRDALTAADAQRCNAEVRVALGHLVEQRHQDPRAARADGMADRDGPPVDIEPVLGHCEFATDGNRLRCERLVELEEVDVTQLDACLLQG